MRRDPSQMNNEQFKAWVDAEIESARPAHEAYQREVSERILREVAERKAKDERFVFIEEETSAEFFSDMHFGLDEIKSEEQLRKDVAEIFDGIIKPLVPHTITSGGMIYFKPRGEYELCGDDLNLKVDLIECLEEVFDVWLGPSAEVHVENCPDNVAPEVEWLKRLKKNLNRSLNNAIKRAKRKKYGPFSIIAGNL